jgi:hypothetical protein
VKLLLDEMLSPAIARELRSRGHDVETVAGNPAREALPDPEVPSPLMTFATSVRCIAKR